jgi:hypothetical protein
MTVPERQRLVPLHDRALLPDRERSLVDELIAERRKEAERD